MTVYIINDNYGNQIFFNKHFVELNCIDLSEMESHFTKNWFDCQLPFLPYPWPKSACTGERLGKQRRPFLLLWVSILTPSISLGWCITQTGVAGCL